MNSKIYLESETSKWSKCHFSILFKPSNEIQTSSSILKTDRKDPHSFLSKRILLAEDNSFNANIAGRYIKGWGAEMDIALNGEQALELVLQNKYDLILMDVQMPVLDGFACSLAIRSHQTEIPIIAITAAPINEVKDQIFQCGMNDYVSKPFKPNELYEKLERYLK